MCPTFINGCDAHHAASTTSLFSTAPCSIAFSMSTSGSRGSGYSSFTKGIAELRISQHWNDSKSA